MTSDVKSFSQHDGLVTGHYANVDLITVKKDYLEIYQISNELG